MTSLIVEKRDNCHFPGYFLKWQADDDAYHYIVKRNGKVIGKVKGGSYFDRFEGNYLPQYSVEKQDFAGKVHGTSTPSIVVLSGEAKRLREEAKQSDDQADRLQTELDELRATAVRNRANADDMEETIRQLESRSLTIKVSLDASRLNSGIAEAIERCSRDPYSRGSA